MSKNLFKRLFSSIILILIIYFFLNSNELLFLSFLSFIFIIACYEFKKIILNTKILILSYLFLLFSFYCFFKLKFLNDNNDYLYFILIICISTDIGGYIIGKTFKGPKLTKISPNKTYSGMIGAFIFALTLSFFYVQNTKNYYFNLSFKDIELYALVLICSSISQLGDIYISLLKRKSKIKDTGNFIPGHGGILDRIDGMIFVFPISYIYYQLTFITL